MSEDDFLFRVTVGRDGWLNVEGKQAEAHPEAVAASLRIIAQALDDGKVALFAPDELS